MIFTGRTEPPKFNRLKQGSTFSPSTEKGFKLYVCVKVIHSNHLRISFQLTCSKRNSKHIPMPKKQRATVMSSGILPPALDDDIDRINLVLIRNKRGYQPEYAGDAHSCQTPIQTPPNCPIWLCSIFWFMLFSDPKNRLISVHDSLLFKSLVFFAS